MRINSLSYAAQITPLSQLRDKLEGEGASTVGLPLQDNNSINGFAFGQYVYDLQSFLTLVDPQNDASGNTQETVTSIQQVTAAYQAAQQLAQPQTSTVDATS